MFAVALAAGRADVPLVLGYNYRTLARDHAAAEAVITGQVASTYDATWDTISQLAPSKRASQTFTVTSIGVAAISASHDHASLLVYGQTAYSDSSTRNPRIDLATIAVTLAFSGRDWLVSNLDVGGNVAFDSTSLGNADLDAAVAAGRREALNLTTYARASFNSDYQRSMIGATGPLLAALKDESKEQALLDQMTRQHFDLKGTVDGVAVERVSSTDLLLLIPTDGSQVPDSGPPTASTHNRFEVTVTMVSGKWLVSNVANVGIR